MRLWICKLVLPVSCHILQSNLVMIRLAEKKKKTTTTTTTTVLHNESFLVRWLKQLRSSLLDQSLKSKVLCFGRLKWRTKVGFLLICLFHSSLFCSILLHSFSCFSSSSDPDIIAEHYSDWQKDLSKWVEESKQGTQQAAPKGVVATASKMGKKPSSNGLGVGAKLKETLSRFQPSEEEIHRNLRGKVLQSGYLWERRFFTVTGKKFVFFVFRFFFLFLANYKIM